MKKTFAVILLVLASMSLLQMGCQYSATAPQTGSPTVSTATTTSSFASGLSGAYGIVADNAGNVYVSEYSPGVIKKITPAGVMTTFASGFRHVRSLAIDAGGNIIVGDTGHYAIKKVSPSGVVTTLVSNPFTYFRPRGIAVDKAGVLYATGGYRIPSVWSISNGHFTTLASGFSTAGRIAVDPNNSNLVYASDNSSHVVNKISSGVVTSIATGVGKTRGITVDNHGNVIFCSSNGNVYMVTPTGNQSVLATFSNPGGIYMSPNNQGTIYVISSSSTVSTVNLHNWP